MTKPELFFRVIFYVVLLYLSMVHLKPAMADDALMLTEDKDFYQLGSYIEILEDKTGKLTLQNILANNYAGNFERKNKEILNFGFTDSVYWIKVTTKSTLKNPNANREWIIRFKDLSVTHFDVYRPDGKGKYGVSKLGTSLPFSDREINHQKITFKLRLEPSESKTIYIRHSDISASIISLSLMTETRFHSLFQNESLSYGVFFGVLFMMILVNLILFLIHKDLHYILYACWLFFTVILLATMYGFFRQYLFPDKHLPYIYTGIIICLSGVFSTYFAINYLNIKNDFPRIYKGLITWTAIWFIWSVYLIYTPWQMIIGSSLTATSLNGLFLLFLSTYQAKKGYNPAIYYMVFAIFGFVSSFVAFTTRNRLTLLGMNPDDLVKFAVFIRVFILSIAIEMKLKATQKEKEAAEQLAIANLKKADHLKDAFLANTSHELRTPIHGMIGIADSLLKRKKFDAEVKEDLGLITSSGRRLANLINDILDFSRIRNNELALNLKPVDLYSTANLTIKLIEPLINQKQLEFINLINPNGQYVMADENRLRQILNNLLGNAAKFTETGYIKIEVSKQGKEFEKDDQLSEMLEIRVSDSGIGIPNDRLKQIFDQFEQAEISLDKKYQGAGLGLTISKKLVELHQGEIWAESVEGKGSSFTFTLPSAYTPAALDKGEKTNKKHNTVFEVVESNLPHVEVGFDEELSYPGESIQGNPNILLVDDDPINIKILERYFSQQTCSYSIAWNGVSALEQVSKGDYELVLLDIMMPGLSGYEVCRRIRQKYPPARLPVIMLTAKIHLSEVDEGFRAGANDYIQKPFIYSELIRRINIVLKQREGHQQPCFHLGKKGDRRLFVVNEVKYLSSLGKHSIVHLVQGEQEVPVMFKDLEGTLPEGFVRIHRQTIVNTTFISRITHIAGGRYKAFLKDKEKTELIVSRTFIGNLREKIDL